ncbi:MAG: 3'-5' exonuclease [Anaerolineae bacterium]|nr:3'-5' exonuclease [Anaerolineae bacterium]
MLDEDFVVLDTETTGLWPEDEIVEIAVIDRAGAVLLNQRIQPQNPARLLKRDAKSGICAADIHGIMPAMLEGQPRFPAVYEQLRQFISLKPLVIYNADYDMKMLNQDCARHSLAMPLVKPDCAMKQFAAWRGVPGKYPGEYRWVKLDEAVTLLGVESDRFGEDVHSALGDCQRTLAVLQGMALNG